MSNITNFFDSIKEFFWDIVGYFIPGCYVLILLSVCINQTYFLEHSIDVKGMNGTIGVVFFVTAYVVGYVVLGISLLKEEMFKENSYKTRIENKLRAGAQFELAKHNIQERLGRKGQDTIVNSTTFRDIRNLVMSFIPDQDQKIYTFTFRYEISNNIGNVSVVIGVVGILSTILEKCLCQELNLFNSDVKYIILYVVLLLLYYPLMFVRDRFYAISMNIPFAIFNARQMVDNKKD